MSILVKERNRFEVVAMADAHQEDGHLVLRLTRAVGRTITANMIARALWVEPRSTMGVQYGITPNAPGGPTILDAAWRDLGPLGVCTRSSCG